MDSDFRNSPQKQSNIGKHGACTMMENGIECFSAILERAHGENARRFPVETVAIHDCRDCAEEPFECSSARDCGNERRMLDERIGAECARHKAHVFDCKEVAVKIH